MAGYDGDQRESMGGEGFHALPNDFCEERRSGASNGN